MDDTPDPITLAAREAVKALRTMGWPVLACEDGEGEWQIGDAILTHAALVNFAIWAPNPCIKDSIAAASPQTCRDPHAPLDSAEALDCIRAVIGVVRHPTVDDEAVAFRLIRAIIKKAPRTG